MSARRRGTKGGGGKGSKKGLWNLSLNIGDYVVWREGEDGFCQGGKKKSRWPTPENHITGVDCGGE